MGNLKTESNVVRGRTSQSPTSNIAPQTTQPTVQNRANNAALTTADGFDDTSKKPTTNDIPASITAARATYPELAGRSDEDVAKVLEAMKKVKNGPTTQDSLVGLAQLHSLFPNTLTETLKGLGVKNATVLKLAANKELTGALAKAMDPAAPAFERVGAAITVAKNLGDTVKLNEFLPKLFAGIPAGAKLASSLATMMDPAKSPFEKASAALEFAGAAKDSLGEAFPKLANELRRTNSGFAVLSSALTLMDPSKSLTERASAAAQLAANGGDIAKDAAKMKEWLSSLKVANADEISSSAVKLNGTTILADDVIKNLPSDVTVSTREATIFNKAAANPDLKDNLAKVLLGVKDSKSATNLAEFIATADPKVAKEVLSTLAGLEHETMAKVLKETIGGKPGLQALSDLITKMPAINRSALAKVIKDFDPKMLETFFELASKADPKTLGLVLKTLEGADSKLIGKGLVGLSEMVTKLGLKMGPEIAGHLLKGVTKMVPLVGTLPALYSMGDLGIKALDPNLPPELRFLAGVGVGMNTVDAALGIIEALGVTNIDAVVQIPLGAAEIGVDLILMSESQKAAEAKKNGQPYVAPRWLDAIIVGSALAKPEVGIPAMISMFGIEGSQRKFMNVGLSAANLTIDVQEMLSIGQAKTTGEAMKLTAKGIDALADVIRNPEKYGKMAKELFQNAYKQLEAAGEKGLEVIKNVANEIYNSGKAGFEKLKWMVENPGETANIALETVSNALKTGLETGKAIAIDAAKKTMQGLIDAYDGAKKGFKEIRYRIGEKIAEVYDYANDLIKQGKDTAKYAYDLIEWGVRNPGDVANIAKNKLVELSKTAGDKFVEVYEWTLNAADRVKGAAQDFYDVTKRTIDWMETEAKKGADWAIKNIVWTAQNPGKAASLVIDRSVKALHNIAASTTKFAYDAADVLRQFVERQGALAKEAKESVTALIQKGTESGKRILAAWSQNLTEGGKAIIDSLANLKNAAGEQLTKMVEYGGQLRDYVLNKVKDGLQTGANYAWQTLESFKKKGGDFANWAISEASKTLPGQFAKRAFDFLSGTVSPDALYQMVQQTGSAARLAKEIYEKEGWNGIANLAKTAGNSVAMEFVRTLTNGVEQAKQTVQGVADSMSKVFSKKEIERITGWDLSAYWPSWAPQ